MKKSSNFLGVIKILMIVAVLICGVMFAQFGNTGTANAQEVTNITLYSAGGQVMDGEWTTVVEGSSYKSNTKIDEMPVPYMGGEDENVRFAGWYNNVNCTGSAVSSFDNNGTYYAKWVRTKNSYSSEYMSYTITGNVDARGKNNLQTTFACGGYSSSYKFSNGSSGSFSAMTSGDVFRDLGNGIYVAIVPYTNGHFVSFTYYIQNRGTSTVSGFALGACADVQIGNNDFAPLTLVTDSMGSYVNMTDGSNALKLFYAGNNAVSDVSTLWTGTYPDHRGNVFSDARRNISNRDSTLALSWKDITIAPSETVTKAFLLGAGTPEELVIKPTLTYVDNIFSNSSTEIGDNFTIKTPASQKGWYFAGWNTSKKGSGTQYSGGQSVSLEKNMRLYAQWREILSPVELTFNLDGDAWQNRNIDLYDSNNFKYDTQYNKGKYVASVRNDEYKVFKDGQDTGKRITVNETNTSSPTGATVSQTYNYFTMQANITSDTLWDNADVTLRSDKGEILIGLPKTSTNGLTATYSTIIENNNVNYNLFVNGRDTKNDMATTVAHHSKDLTYYDISVSLFENGTAKSDADVTISNGTESYILISNNGVYTEKLLDDNTVYSVSVSGVVDDGSNASNDILSSVNKSLTLNYFTIDAKTYERNGSDYSLRAQNHRTYHVRSGNTVSNIPSAYVDGLTFNCWSIDPWILGEKEDSVSEYDFSTKILEHTTLYAHFLKAEVIINGYVRTDVNGALNSAGMYLTTPNLTISGFDKGNESIQSVLIQTTDFVQVQFLSLETNNHITANVVQGNNYALNANNIATNDSIVINFAEKVSMIEAQEYLRTQVVYQPTISTAMSLKIMVSDGVISASSSQAISQNVVTNAYNVISSSPNKNTETTFNKTTWYYFAENADGSAKKYTFDGRGTNGSGKSGIVISGTVHFYIPATVTVEAYGANGSGTTGGAAGIRLPANAYLYVIGGGKLIAVGGNAANGSDGAKGGDGSYDLSDTIFEGKKYDVQMSQGIGGKGGNGGGGAGAGIGSNGGKGGTGGNGGGSYNWYTWSKSKTCKNGQHSGVKGGDGYAAAAVGFLYNNSSSPVTIEAKGGASGKGGIGGDGGSYAQYKGTDYRTIAGGGGGGGGAGGSNANNIGCGGAGGGGGGGGGAGAIAWGGANYTPPRAMGGYGGIGGAGIAAAAIGKDGKRVTINVDTSFADGAAGGAKGEKGTDYKEGVINSWNKYIFTVQFIGENGKDVLQSQEYMYQELNIPVPDYTPSAGYVFLGWQVATYGKNTVVSGTQPLTSADKNLIQPGENIKLSKYTYGNITLKPVTMPISGKSANDKLSIANNVFVSGTQPTTAYYTYKLKLTLDGNPYDFGQIKLVNTANPDNVYKLSSSSEVGTYKIILNSDDTFKVYVGNQKLIKLAPVMKAAKGPMLMAAAPAGSTDLELGSVNEETVNFNTLNVNVSGVNPENVKLLGENAPSIEEVESVDGSHKFTAFAQEGVDLSKYQIKIDDYVVPTTTAFYGSTANVVFAHIDATVKSNTVVNTVELKSENKTISLIENDGVWSVSETIDEETVYTLYINGAKTGVTTKLNSPDIQLVGEYYYIDVITRLNSIPTELGVVAINGNEITHTTNPGEWCAFVVDSEELTVTVDGVQVKVLAPSEESDVVYIDYYTVTYTSQNSSGTCPVDTKYYLSGASVTLSDENDLFSNLADYYFAGWSYNDKVYAVGDIYEITNPTTFNAVWKLDNFKVQFVDNGDVVQTLSQLPLTYIISTIAGTPSFKDATYEYTFKGWLCSLDGKVYNENEVTEFVVSSLIEDDTLPFNENGVKIVEFTAVYELEYLYGIHFEEVVNENVDTDILDENKNVVLNQEDTDKEIIIDYKVTVNDGVNSIVIMPLFNDAVFELTDIKVNGETVLGSATLTYDYLNAECPVKVLFGGKDIFNTTGDVLFTITYKMINAIGGEYNFGLLTDYRELTTDEIPDNSTRSHAYFWDNQNEEEQTEVKIFVDKLVSVFIQMKGVVTVEDQEFVYDSESLTAGIIYCVAEEYDEEETYYEYIDGAFVEATDLTSDNFADKTYFVANSINDVIFSYNGLGVDPDCTIHAQYTIRWYSFDGETYTEISAPKDVGTYFVGIVATENNFYTESDEAMATVKITPANITITIDDKESVWNEDLAELTGEITDGVIYDGDELGISYSTTVTSTSDVGVYTDAIIGSWNENPNYLVTFVLGDYEILIADNSFVVELITENRDYTGEVISEGTVEAIADFYAESKYGDADLTYKFYTFDGEETYTVISAPKNAGEYYVKAFVAGDPTKYNALESDYVKIVISKALVTIDDLTASSKVYNHDTQVWVLSDISGVPDGALYTLSSVSAIEGEDYINVGTPTVRVYAVVNDSDNYEFADGIDYKDAVGAITPFAITITANNQSSQYTGEEVVNVSNNYTISVVSGEVPAFVYDDELSITVVRIVSDPASEGEWKNVGEYDLTVTYSTDNYTVTVVNGTYTITKAYVVVPTLINYVYDKTEKVQKNAEDSLYTFEQTKTDAGTYAITVKLLDSDNYMWVNVNEQKVSFNSEEVYYICDETGNMVKAYLMTEFANNQIYYTYGIINDYQEADSFDEATIYYTFNEEKGEYTQATGVTAENFGDNTYYVFVEEGYIRVQTDCVEFFEGDEIELAWVISPAKVVVTIVNKESVYGDSLSELTSEVTDGEVYEGDDLAVVLTKADGLDVGTYAITGTWNNANYEVTFVDGTYTITVRTVGGDDYADIVSAIEGAIKEYTGEELSWDISDFTLNGILNQVESDNVYEITLAQKIEGQDYINANGKVSDDVWSYYTKESANIIKKYALTVSVIDDNYVFTGNTSTANIVVEVFIKQATNEWTTNPSVLAETYDDVVKTSVAKFGDDSANNFVAFYSEKTCETQVDVANLEAGEEYYAKFKVAETDNYTGLEEVIKFELGFNVNGELVVYFETDEAELIETITYNGLQNFFAKLSDGTELYNENGEGEGYTYEITATENAWKNVGTYTLTFKVKDNWVWNDMSDGEIVYTLVINKAPLKITVDDKEIEYLDGLPTYTVTPSDDGFVNSETFGTYSVDITDYISCNYTVGSPVNTYKMVLADDETTTLANALYNYDLTLVKGTLTVNKKTVGVDDNTFDINVKMEDVTVTYDAQSHNVKIAEIDGVVATYTIDGANGNEATDVKRDDSKAVKAYVVVATLALTGTDAYGNNYQDNYELKESTISANLTINPLDVTVTAEDKTSVYSETIKEYTSAVAPEFYERDEMSVDYSIYKNTTAITLTSESDVGEYVIKALAQGKGLDNYNITYVDGAYTITIASNIWTVELDAIDRDYNGVSIIKGTSEAHADYFSEAKFGDETTTYTFYTCDGMTYTEILAPATVGTYYVKATVAETNNYTGLESEYVKIEISKKKIGVNQDEFELNVKFEDVEVIYDAQNHTMTISNVDGVIATYTIDGITGNSAIDVKRNASTSVVESYKVIATLTLTGTDDAKFSYADNYELTANTVSANLTIKPLEVTVTAEDKEVVYGDEPKELTSIANPIFYTRDNVEVSFVVNDDETPITLANDTNVGTYTIIPSAVKIGNYDVTYVNGTYTINLAEFYEDGGDDDESGLKIILSAEDVYYNRSLEKSYLVKVGTQILDESKYSVTFFDNDGNEVTPVNAGVYTMKVIVEGTNNYLGEGNDAFKTVNFEIKKIALKPTTFTYNKDTATWAVVTEDVGADDVAVKALKSGTVLAYTIGGVDYTNTRSYTATETGTYTVVVTATNDDNYIPSEATTVNVYSVGFAEGSHDKQEAKGVEGVDAYATQYRFKNEKATKPVNPEVEGYTFKQWNNTEYVFDTPITADTVLIAIWDINTYTVTWYNQGVEIYNEKYSYKDTPTYNTTIHGVPTKESDAEYTYTHSGWNIISDTVETIELPLVTENATYYAIFEKTANGYTITYYISEDGGEYRFYKAVTDVAYDSYINIEELNEVAWFKTESWFTNEERSISAPEKMLARNLSLYGAYVFDIGLGDVNADGIVNVDDITMYRQWIVGNYDIADVEVGTEWALVHEDGFTTETHYFVKRVADVNNMVENSGRLDIRDASTIRMALVGGFNWGVATEFNVTGQEVAKSQRVSTEEEFIYAVNNLAIVTLADDIELTRDIEVVKDITIYLNGHTITAESFSLTSNVTDVTITLINGKIVTEEGVEISAPNGNVTLKDIEAYDKEGLIKLNATTESLHFNGRVAFCKGTTEDFELTQVIIPADTRVVVEAGAKLEIAKINVEPVAGYTLSLVVNSQESNIVVNGEALVSGEASSSVKCQFEIISEEELVSAISDQTKDVIDLANDITLTQSVYIEREITLNLNGYTISAPASGKLVGTDSMFVIKRGGKLIINDTNGGKITTGNNANVYAPIKMTTKGETEKGEVASVVINGGTFEGYFYAIVGNGKRHDTEIVINGGVLKGLLENDSTAIYHPQNGVLTINGGEFIGSTALYIKSGTVNITGGTFTANGEINPYAYSGNGSYQTGDAIVIDNCNYPGDNPIVNISDDIVLTNDRKVVNYWYVKNEAQLREAILKGDVVVLGENITLTERIYVEKDIVLKLNKKTIMYAGGSLNSGVFTITRGNELTVTDEGTINSGNNAYAVFALTKKDEGANGEVAKLTIENGTFIGYYYAIVGNGKRHDTEIVINGGVLKGVAEDNNTAIYHPQNGVLTINGGEFIGSTALYIKSGTVNITGGTFTANGEINPYEFSNNGFQSTGDAIVIDNCNYPGENAKVTIDEENIVLTDDREIKVYDKIA